MTKAEKQKINGIAKRLSRLINKVESAFIEKELATAEKIEADLRKLVEA